MRALVVVAAVLVSMPAFAQGKVGVTTKVNGTVSVSRSVTSSPLMFMDDLFGGDRITTGDQSLARILMGGKAVMTVQERSVVTIADGIAELTGGELAMAVAGETMRPGECLRLKTPNALATLCRGGIVRAEVSQPASASGRCPTAVTSRFTVLAAGSGGYFELAALDPVTGRPNGTPVIVQASQTTTIAGCDLPTRPEPPLPPLPPAAPPSPPKPLPRLHP